MVGLNGVATASVAYHESLEYARTRPQGRPLRRAIPTRRRSRSSSTPTCAACCCARRRSSKAASRCSSTTALLRRSRRARRPTPTSASARALLLDLLTPIAKSFPAERGFESNALARADPRRLRLLERVPARGVAARSEAQHASTRARPASRPRPARPQGRSPAAARASRVFLDEVERDASRARARPASTPTLATPLGDALGAARRAHACSSARSALAGDVEACCCTAPTTWSCSRSSSIAWQWLRQAAVAAEALARDARPDATSTRASSPPRSTGSPPSCRASPSTRELCKSGERSFADMRNEWF